MAGLFSRLKIWNPSETLTNTDLNAEFDHFLANIDAEHSEGYSQNLSNMQSTEDPGDVGSENLTQPISTAQEIQRIRYKIDEIIGGAQWYSTPSSSLASLTALISDNINLPGNRLIDCLKNAAGQPIALQPDSGASVVLKASNSDPVVVAINGTEYTFTSDITLGGLSTAPASNNTCLNTSVASATDSSRAFGQYYIYNTVSGDSYDVGNGSISIGTVGSNVSSTAGTVQVFKLAAGGGDEYFMAQVDTSSLYGAKRGFFFGPSGAHIQAQTILTGETLTIMKTGYVFLKTDGTLGITYNTPSYQDTAPTSFSLNDYWFDYSEDKWKIYNGSSFVDANALFIGLIILDSSQAVASRTTDIYRNFDEQNSIEIRSQQSGSGASAVDIGGSISVYGSPIELSNVIPTWDLTSNVASGESAAAGLWYCYITQYGDRFISRKPPNNRPDLKGLYHPAAPWRAVGWFTATGASSVNSAILSSGSFRLTPRNDSTRAIRIMESVRRDQTNGTANYGQIAISNALGADFTTSSTSLVDVTGLSLTLACTGDHLVYIGLFCNSDISSGFPTDGGIEISQTTVATTGASGYTTFNMDSGTLFGAQHMALAFTATASIKSVIVPVGSINSLYQPTSGVHTFKLQTRVQNGTNQIRIPEGTFMIAFEIW